MNNAGMELKKNKMNLIYKQNEIELDLGFVGINL